MKRWARILVVNVRIRALKVFPLLLFAFLSVTTSSAQTMPPPEAFTVLPAPVSGPQITPYLRYQTDLAWQQDAERLAMWRRVENEADLRQLQAELRQKLLTMLGGLPEVSSPLHPRVTGTIPMNNFHIEKLIFESLPGIYVTALLYLPDDGAHGKVVRHPAMLVAAGHASDGKAHYQVLCQRLVQRGYVVLSWDPVGQGERSQFWDAKTRTSRYNLICAEHAVLGNLAYLAGTNLARWEIWDGLRAFDYLQTRPEVDPERIGITGTSGGGFQAMHIAALQPRIKIAAISCYITALPMRMHNRIFKDPDSDPEQDLYGMISRGVGHSGLLLLMYPRPVFVAAAVLDFFPIEGTEKTFREVEEFYRRFGHADRIAIAEGYHGHQFSDMNQEAAFEFLDHFNGMPIRKSLAAAKELDGASVQCTHTGQVMQDFPDSQPLVDLIRGYYIEHKNTQTGSIRELYYAKGYPEIRKWSFAEYTGLAPTEGTAAWEKVGSSSIGGVVIDRYAVHHSGGLVMPLLHVHRTSGPQRGWRIWLGRNGKGGPKDWPEIMKELDAGYEIVSFDFRGLGETRMPYKAVSEDDPSFALLDYEQAYVNPLSSVLADYVYNSVLIGRPYFLQMLEDVEIALRFSQMALHATGVSLAVDDENALLADAIASVLELRRSSSSSTPLLRWSDLVMQRREQWPIQYLLPGGAYIQ